MLDIKWIILVISIAILVLSVLIYHKIKTCNCNKSENYHESVYDYLNMYNNAYTTPRPNFYDMCHEYNQWARDANDVGKMVSEECKKKFPGDPRCPEYLPWTETTCSTFGQ